MLRVKAVGFRVTGCSGFRVQGSRMLRVKAVGFIRLRHGKD